MNDNFSAFTVLLPQLLGSLPLWLVYLVGMLVVGMRRRGLGRAAGLGLAGFALLLFGGLYDLGVSFWFQRNAMSGNLSSQAGIAMALTALRAVSILIHGTASVCLMAAIVVRRPPPAPTQG